MTQAETNVDLADLYVPRGAAVAVPALADVDEAALARYEAEGYLAVAAAFDGQTTRAAADGLLDLINRPEPRAYQLQFEKGREQLAGLARIDAVRKLGAFTAHEARLHAMAYHPDLLRVVEEILGGPSQMIQDMALLKPPQGGREKPWHQDKAYFDYPAATKIVGVWIALDATSAENGCMHVMPGSHRAGPVIHFQVRDWQICDREMQDKACLTVPLQPGGLLLFDGLLHHGTPPNRSSTRRWAVQFHYILASVQKVSEGERLAIYGSDGKNVSC